MSPLDEERYARLMAPRLEVWQERARSGSGETRVAYALARARALARPYVAKLARCSVMGVRVKCGCRGWRGVRPYTCRQHLVCESCQRDRARRMGMRMRAGLEAALAGAERGSRLVLLTLTLRHSGDVAADRAALASGWRAFYRALWGRWGKFPYVGVWEVTPGADGRGHVHAHVAVVWPWRDWGVCRELWLAACPESERITFVAGRRDGRASDPKSVANYLGKYLSKGVQAAEFTPALRADVVAAAYNTRWVFSSRRFWQEFRPCCKNCGKPVVAAQYRFRGVAWVPDTDGDVSPRGSPQPSLALPEPYERPSGRRIGRVLTA